MTEHQTTERPATGGDLCTCGRQAVTVFVTEQYGEVGHCGVEGAAANPVTPCPWCGATEPHTASWGDPQKCPQYRLRPGGPAAMTYPPALADHGEDCACDECLPEDPRADGGMA